MRTWVLGIVLSVLTVTSLSAWEKRGRLAFAREPIETLYLVPAEYATRYTGGFEERALTDGTYCGEALAWRVYYFTWISMKEKMEEEGYRVGANQYVWALGLAYRRVEEFVDLTGLEIARPICQAAFNEFRKFYVGGR